MLRSPHHVYLLYTVLFIDVVSVGDTRITIVTVEVIVAVVMVCDGRGEEIAMLLKQVKQLQLGADL